MTENLWPAPTLSSVNKMDRRWVELPTNVFRLQHCLLFVSVFFVIVVQHCSLLLFSILCYSCSVFFVIVVHYRSLLLCSIVRYCCAVLFSIVVPYCSLLLFIIVFLLLLCTYIEILEIYIWRECTMCWMLTNFQKVWLPLFCNWSNVFCVCEMHCCRIMFSNVLKCFTVWVWTHTSYL